MGPTAEKDLFSKVSRQERATVSREVLYMDGMHEEGQKDKVA